MCFLKKANTPWYSRKIGSLFLFAEAPPKCTICGPIKYHNCEWGKACFIPLYPKFPLFSVQSTYVAIRLDDIVLALFLFIWLLYQIKNRFPVLKKKITPLFIAYFIAILISTLNAILIYQTTSTEMLLLNAFRRFEYMSVFFIAIEAVKKRRDFLFPYIFLRAA